MSSAANAASVVWEHAETTPAVTALRFGEDVWTYRDVRSQASAFAGRLRGVGVEPGQRVLLVAPTSPEFVFAYYGILSIGAVAVTVNTLSTEPELAYFIEDAGCAAAVGWHETADPVKAATAAAGLELLELRPDPSESDCEPVPLHEVSSADPAALLYTSGTTGRPKGAILSHANLRICGQTFQAALGLDALDRMGTALPLFHVFGQAAVMSTVFTVGASLSLLRPFSGPALLGMAAEHELTALAGVPTMWNEMLHAETELTAESFAHLRLASSGGAALPLEVAKAFKDRFGATVLDGYGLTETTGAATFNTPDVEPREGSVGRALPGVAVTTLDAEGKSMSPHDIGEVAIRGPIVMQGYWNRPEATARVMRGDWFLTGDLGYLNEDGFLWIVDRKKDLVIRGGYNVYPSEVEEVLYAHPHIREAAVIGVPDERLGEEIAAVIATVDGGPLDFDELRQWLSEQLSAYKVPRLYQLVDALPKGATGKILKRGIDRNEILHQGIRAQRPSQATTPAETTALERR